MVTHFICFCPCLFYTSLSARLLVLHPLSEVPPPCHGVTGTPPWPSPPSCSILSSVRQIWRALGHVEKDLLSCAPMQRPTHVRTSRREDKGERVGGVDGEELWLRSDTTVQRWRCKHSGVFVILDRGEEATVGFGRTEVSIPQL